MRLWYNLLGCLTSHIDQNEINLMCGIRVPSFNNLISGFSQVSMETRNKDF